MILLHRFLIFNDALAARVPYLAGRIHLTPDVFVAAADGTGFCAQRNAQIAAHVAEAANDEYRFSPGSNMVHQHLSQDFFRAAFAYFGERAGQFEALHPVTATLTALISEARTKFFDTLGAPALFAALGFHVGLEFFANEEFNLVDSFLNEAYPRLVEAMKSGEAQSNPYLWLSLHTVVEIGHYRAGLEAVREALELYCDQAAAPLMADHLLGGLEAFADLQLRYYQAVFAEIG